MERPGVGAQSVCAHAAAAPGRAGCSTLHACRPGDGDGQLGPGSMVLVHWSDGNRYPGTVLQSATGQLLVAFPNGQQQWVDARYVSLGA